MGYYKEVLAVFQRGLIVLWRNKVLLFGNLLMPIAVIIIIGPAAEAQTLGDLGFDELATGMMCMMIFFSGMFIPNNIIWDRDSKFLNIMFVSPCRRSSIILGYSLVGSVRSVLQVIIIYCGASVISASMDYGVIFTVPALFALIGLTILATVFVGGFMTIIASYSKNSETFFLLSGMIGMPIIFLSNVFFKPESLPFNLGLLGKFNPLNYLVDTVRFLVTGQVEPGTNPWIGPVLFGLLAAIFTVLGTYIFVRTIKKR